MNNRKITTENEKQKPEKGRLIMILPEYYSVP